MTDYELEQFKFWLDDFVDSYNNLLTAVEGLDGFWIDWESYNARPRDANPLKWIQRFPSSFFSPTPISNVKNNDVVKLEAEVLMLKQSISELREQLLPEGNPVKKGSRKVILD